MRAWQVLAAGEPEDVLRQAELEIPTPGPGQALIEVEAAAVNFPDLLLCRGQYHHKPPFPFTLGCEAAGRISAVGPGADLEVGTRVLTAPLSYGCFAGEVLVCSGDALPIPDSLPAAAAAGLFMAYQTAWIALHRRARLQPGERLLVHGATGGVGSAAVQLGKAAGATVIATVGEEDKAAFARALGADHVVLHRTEEVAPRVLELTGGHGADVIFDPVGGPLFDASRRCVGVEGRILVIGFAAGIPSPLAVNHALIKNYAVIGVRLQPYREDRTSTRAVHDELVRLYELGAIAPRIHAELPMDAAPKAVAMLRDRGVMGRVVLRA